MLFRFDDFTLDTDRAELRGPQGQVPTEPKTLALLRFLVENNDRVLSRDDMIEAVWGGRIVSNAAVSTVLKQVRKALGDGAKTQHFVRTIHGQGHRFVAEVRIAAAGSVGTAISEGRKRDPRPTIAVLPFSATGMTGVPEHMPAAIAAEVIASLSRLRWLRVIARETTFRFRNRSVTSDDMRDVLGADYLLSGDVSVNRGQLAVGFELSETDGGTVIWADRLARRLGDVHDLRQSIVDAVLTAMEISISRNEAEIARLQPSENLDAWRVFHLGLAHAYRFTHKENTIAAGLFRRATELDPEFSAAWAARSFTSFQDAFMGFQPDREEAIREARWTAEHSVELDPAEPSANYAMGRLAILSGKLGTDTGWLDRAVELSPSFAKGHYSRALVDMLSGRTSKARDGIERAVLISPLDPLLGPMIGVRAHSYLMDGRIEEAYEMSLRALRAGPSHVINGMSAAAISALYGKAKDAEQLAEWVRERRPDASLGLYFSALPMVESATRDQLRTALSGLGFSP